MLVWQHKSCRYFAFVARLGESKNVLWIFKHSFIAKKQAVFTWFGMVAPYTVRATSSNDATKSQISKNDIVPKAVALES